MENQFSINKNIPDSLRTEILRIENKVIELEKLRLCLKEYPETVFARRKIGKIVSDAKLGIREVEKYYPTDNDEFAESAFLFELKEHSEKLWSMKLLIDIQ
jgi:hypothetical protein